MIKHNGNGQLKCINWGHTINTTFAIRVIPSWRTILSLRCILLIISTHQEIMLSHFNNLILSIPLHIIWNWCYKLTNYITNKLSTNCIKFTGMIAINFLSYFNQLITYLFYQCINLNLSSWWNKAWDNDQNSKWNDK